MNIQQTNTILYCDDWAAAVAFYRDILHFSINYQNDWFVEFQLTAQSYLSVADASRATIDSVNGQGITLAWQVDDMQRVYADLQEQGITVTPIQQKWGAHLFYIHDPEGHRIEFWQPLD